MVEAGIVTVDVGAKDECLIPPRGIDSSHRTLQPAMTGKVKATG